MSGIIQRFKGLCPIDNPSGGEALIRQTIGDALTEMNVTDQTVDSGGNLLVRVPGDPQKDILMLSAHMDSVPPCHGIVPVDDVMEGRKVVRSQGKTILGADDKSGIAMILEIVNQLSATGFKTNHPLELFFSTREEIGLLGAKEYDPQWSKAVYCYVLDGEGSVGDIFNAGPFQENLEIHCLGKGAHAGIAPELGISAIEMAAHLIAKLPSGRIHEKLTTNVGTIEGGSAMNVTAPEARIRAEARSLVETELTGLIKQYREACQETERTFSGSKIDLKVIRKYNGFQVPETSPVIVKAQAVFKALGITSTILPMNIGSDAHVLNHSGLPTVVLGMGFHYSHSLGEYLFTDELEQVFKVVQALVA